MQLTATKLSPATLMRWELPSGQQWLVQAPAALPDGTYTLSLTYLPAAASYTLLILGVRGYSMRPLWVDGLGAGMDASAMQLGQALSSDGQRVVPLRVAFLELLELLRAAEETEPLTLLIGAR